MARILVVDDNGAIREALVAILTMHGHEAAAAKDGVEALKLIAEQSPELIVLDLFMPKMDGLELLAALRKMDRMPKAIIMSGNLSPIRETLLNVAHLLGATRTLLKPFSLDDFLAAVEQALQE